MATAGLIELVILCVRQIVGNVIVETPSQLKRQQLRAITDSQYRDFSGQGGAEQRAIECDLSLARRFDVHRIG